LSLDLISVTSNCVNISGKSLGAATAKACSPHRLDLDLGTSKTRWFEDQLTQGQNLGQIPAHLGP